MDEGQRRFAGLQWDRWAELILIALAAGFTVYQARSAAETIARQAAFDSLRESYIDFTKGHSEFKARLYEIRNALPVDVEESDDVNQLNGERLENLREVVAPIVGAKLGYEGTVFAAIPLWPRPIRAQMLNMMGHGVAVAECYEAAAMRALTKVEVQETKTKLNGKCVHLGTQANQFNIDDVALNARMAQHLRIVAEDLGAADDELTLADNDTPTSGKQIGSGAP